MAKIKTKKDNSFLFIILGIAIGGLFIFASASLGILAKDEDKFVSIALNQLFFGFGGGILAFFITSKINYKIWKKFSLLIFIISTLITFLVFIPGIGWGHGGATRWISIADFNFQPSEFLKIGFVMYLSAILSKQKNKEGYKGLLFFIGITCLAGIPILLQPDNDTFAILAFAGFIIYFISGAKWKNIFIILGIGIVLLGSLILIHPYVKERILTFINPSRNPESSGYQIQQSLIAIGSGGLTGKGFGQSVQKWGALPEPISDSIFAVASEEFGFVGSTTIILIFLFFALKSFKIASQINDDFGKLLCVGIVVLIISGAFINIASMLGLIPLSGTPLPFISQGGTALLSTLALSGIIFNISKNIKTK